MSYASLVALKPKRLSDSIYAYLRKDLAVLDFGTAKVVLEGDNGTDMPPCTISLARLFTGAYEFATSLAGREIGEVIPESILWSEIPINVNDVSVFNAAASAGEDLYWHGEINISGGEMQIIVQGLVYYMTYKMPKMASFMACIPLDFNICWYLYQMFKDVSKKNLGTLFIGVCDNKIYLTNKEEAFYIIVDPSHIEFTEKRKSVKVISEAFDDIEYSSKGEISKKALSLTPLEKHLMKPFDELIQMSESQISRRYCNAFYCVHINKAKVT